MNEGRSGFDGEQSAASDGSSSLPRSTHHCSFCDTDYGDWEEAMQCCLAVEAIRVIIESCDTCIKGVCQCGEARNGGVER